MIAQEALTRLQSMIDSVDPEDRDGEYCFFLPYSDLRGWVEQDDFLFRASEMLHLRRLDGVRTLSFVNYAGDNSWGKAATNYNQTRFDHSLGVARVDEEISRRNSLSGKEVKIGVVSALIHDRATPAGGNATKKVDPERLDEEIWWHEDLDHESEELFEELGITQSQVDKIIHNRGMLGKILDVADWITYVMKDLYEAVGHVGPQQWLEDSFLTECATVIAEDHAIGDIYKEVRIDAAQEDVFFTDPQRLKRFLTLRALLHRDLYLDPISQGKDLKTKLLIEKFYTRDESSPEDLLTPRRLREMTDYELTRYFADKCGCVDDFCSFSQEFYEWYPHHFERFEDVEQARNREEELKNTPGITVFGTREIKGFNPGTLLNVRSEDGTILPYRQYDPKGAVKIEAMAQETKGVYVYYVVNEEEESDFYRLFENNPV